MRKKREGRCFNPLDSISNNDRVFIELENVEKTSIKIAYMYVINPRTTVVNMYVHMYTYNDHHTYTHIHIYIYTCSTNNNFKLRIIRFTFSHFVKLKIRIVGTTGRSYVKLRFSLCVCPMNFLWFHVFPYFLFKKKSVSSVENIINEGTTADEIVRYRWPQDYRYFHVPLICTP